MTINKASHLTILIGHPSEAVETWYVLCSGWVTLLGLRLFRELWFIVCLLVKYPVLDLLLVKLLVALDLLVSPVCVIIHTT